MVYLLWDESHLWGVLMLRALEAWGVNVRLVRAAEVRAGALTPGRAALVVPGGFASRKAASLGQAGLEGVRAFVRQGGAYLGVCGGAGLGLTVPAGLGLCPWTRSPFASRLQHFASGHVHLAPDAQSPYVPAGLSGEPLAPVWWPARFRQGEGAVEVVARYGAPGPDFMMADIPLAMVPGETLEDWEALYGVRLTPSFSPGDPCIVAGTYGQGRYVLSHAHLETPCSPEANAWLAHILAELGGAPPQARPAQTPSPLPASALAQTTTPAVCIPAGAPLCAAAGAENAVVSSTGVAASAPAPAAPAWTMGQARPAWEDPVLEQAMARMLDTARLGIEHGLLTWREPWLLGWRQGLPGAQLSGLLAMLDHARQCAPGPGARAYWQAQSAAFARNVELLAKGLSGYLLAERLALTLWRVDPQAVPQRGLAEARFMLFGPPPGTGAPGGGLCGEVLDRLERFIWLCGQGERQAQSGP